MEWIEVTVPTAPAEVDRVCALLESIGVEGLVIEDESQIRSFLEENRKYWDYVDEEFSRAISGVSRVKFYLEKGAGEALLRRAEASLPDRELSARAVRDEDWENNWRAFYKPIPVGEKLEIVPSWEKATDSERIPLRLDPGLIFGTGGHATTQMCLVAAEKAVTPGCRVLDLGCGSGILAIAALLLGAGTALGCDIDDKAPKVVSENGALNGFGPDRLTALAGDAVSDRRLREKLGKQSYQVVFMNIVADVVLALAPSAALWCDRGGTVIASGIIDGREKEVEAGLTAAGLTVAEHLRQDNWHAFVCRKP